MNKQLFLNSIQKSYLSLTGVEDYYINVIIKDKVLTLKTYNVAYKSTVISELVLPGFDLPDTNVVIREPDKLIKLLDLCKDEIELSFVDKYDIKLFLKDNKIKSEFVLVDTKVLPQSIRDQFKVEIDEPEVYEIQINIDSTLQDLVNKSKKALGSELLSISGDILTNKIEFKIGDNNTYSSNLSFDLEHNNSLENDIEPLYFSVDTFLTILDKNKKCEGSISIYSEGLMKMEFKHIIDEIEQKIIYYMFALDNMEN